MLGSLVKGVGDALGGVAKGVGDVVGGAAKYAGGILPAVMGGSIQPEGFKGKMRNIDKDAFKIESSKTSAARANQLRRAAQRKANLASSQEQQARRGQSGLIQQLQDQAAGRGPSLAQAQLKSAQDRTLQQQLAAAASQRGGNQAALQRALARSQAEQGQQLAQQAAQLRLTEQQQAQQQLGQALQQQRGADLQSAQLQEQLINQRLQQGFGIELARQQAAADFERLQTNQFLAAQGLTAQSDMASQQAQSNMFGSLISGAAAAAPLLLAASDKDKKQKVKSYSHGGKIPGKPKKPGDSPQNDNVPAMLSPGEIVIPKSVASQGEKSISAFVKGLKAASNNSGKYSKGGEVKEDSDKKMSDEDKKSYSNIGKALSQGQKKTAQAYGRAADAAGAMASKYTSKISDENKKKNKDFSPKEFLNALKAVSYEYKDEAKNAPGGGEGRYLGIMAQDLEKAGPVGKSMVKDTPQGKMVDMGKGFGAILAAQAHLNERLQELESRKKKA